MNKQTSVFITVSYQLLGDKLVRISISPFGAKSTSVLLNDVNSIHLYYLTALQQWSDQWDPSPVNMVSNATIIPSLIPRAMRIKMQIKGIGTIQWDFVNLW